METLPPKWQEVLRSIYWDGRSNLETSDQLQTNPQTVATWHLRSRKRLGDEFRKTRLLAALDPRSRTSHRRTLSKGRRLTTSRRPFLVL